MPHPVETERPATTPTELQLLWSFPAMIWRSRAEDGLCFWFNDGWLTFTGRTLEQEWGDGWTEGVHPDDFDRCLEIYTTAFAQQESFAMEYRLRRHDGVYRWILDLGRPVIDDDGTFSGYIGACYDVNDRREMVERLQAAQTTTTLFLQTIYHDLRAPLATMGATVTTLASGRGSDEERAAMLGGLSRQLAHAREILDEVRLMDEASSDTLVARPVPVDATDLIESVIADLDAPDHIVEATTDLGTVTLDPVIVTRALENLVRNAVVHTPPGTHVHVSIAQDDGHYLLHVTDNGPGITDTQLSRALNPQPSHSSPTTGGLGLGLSLVARYAQALGGHLHIQPTDSTGTQAVLSIPTATT